MRLIAALLAVAAAALSAATAATATPAPSDEIELIDSNGNVIGTPSAPDAQANGFNVCTWATSCAAP